MRSTTSSCNPLLATVKANKHLSLAEKKRLGSGFAETRNLDSWAACRAMAVQAVATVPARHVDTILDGMSSRGYINRGDQEELLRGAAAAGLSAEHQRRWVRRKVEEGLRQQISVM